MSLDALTGLFHGIAYDILALAAFAIIIAVDSLRGGIGRACAIALALPSALLAYSLIGNTAFLSDFSLIHSSPRAETAAFAVIAVIMYLLARRMSVEYVDYGAGEPIPALIAGIAATAVLIVVWLEFPFSEQVWHLSPQIQTAFAEPGRLAWLVGAYLALAFARG